jgi:tetratricopeptide (TPR) repeat protein
MPYLMAGRPSPEGESWSTLIERIDAAIAHGTMLAKLHRLRLGVVGAAWRQTGDRRWIDEARTTVQGIARYEPHGLSAWVDAGKLFAAMNQPDEASRCYQRALRIDTNYYLDPDSRLSDESRSRLRAFIAREGELDASVRQSVP